MKLGVQLLVLLLFIVCELRSQSNEFSFLPNIGVTSPFLTEGLGIHIGFNPSVTVSQRVSIEGQVSYIHNPVKSTFLSGLTREDNTINMLAGGRYYLNPVSKKTRFYINLLIGGARYHSVRSSGKISKGVDLGVSSGFYAEFNRLVLGATIDTPSNPVLKLGYIF